VNPAPIRMRRAGLPDVGPLSALQHAAFAGNRAVLGVEPLPLLADYAEVIATRECWLAVREAELVGALIVEPEDGTLLVWSIAVSPDFQGAQLGRQLMTFAEERAREQGFAAVTLYTGEKLEKNIAWYQRLGYHITGIEALADRNIVHMKKPVSAAN
jgi:ribosomal protein S18 acetylase RimI-like enzyme